MAFVAGESLLDPFPVVTQPFPSEFAPFAVAQQIDKPVYSILAANNARVGEQTGQMF